MGLVLNAIAVEMFLSGIYYFDRNFSEFFAFREMVSGSAVQ